MGPSKASTAKCSASSLLARWPAGCAGSSISSFLACQAGGRARSSLSSFLALGPAGGDVPAAPPNGEEPQRHALRAGCFRGPCPPKPGYVCVPCSDATSAASAASATGSATGVAASVGKDTTPICDGSLLRSTNV